MALAVAPCRGPADAAVVDAAEEVVSDGRVTRAERRSLFLERLTLGGKYAAPDAIPESAAHGGGKSEASLIVLTPCRARYLEAGAWYETDHAVEL
jgi:hypothetical protein